MSKLQKLLLLMVLAYAAFIRLQALGYQEFQGDEILTIDFTERYTEIDPLPSFPQYLMTRDKGPLQYIINKVNYSLFHSFNEVVIRLPYTLAGIGFVLALFLLAKRFSGNVWVGLLAAAFAATNGLFISFSRIAQYQSFVQLLLALAALLLLKNTYLLAGLLFGLASLFHYDAWTFLAFAGFWFGRKWFHREDSARKRVCQEFFLFLIPLLVLTTSFYVPFFFRPAEESASGYLATRIFGSGFMPRTLYVSELMDFYMPREVLYILIGLSCLSLGLVVRLHSFPDCRTLFSRAYEDQRRKIGSGSRRWKVVFITIGLPLLLVADLYFSTLWLKPRLSTLIFYALAGTALVFLFFIKQTQTTWASLIAWFLASSVFYLFFAQSPRTHVYIIFIPMFILSAWVIVRALRVGPYFAQLGLGPQGTHRISKGPTLFFRITGYGFLLFFLLANLTYNYLIFIEKDPEYMWGEKLFLGRSMFEIEKNYFKRIDGIFGFPQRREWEQVRDLYDRGCLTGNYDSNEKNRITEFYLGRKQAEPPTTMDNYILVESPVSWEYTALAKPPPFYVPLQAYYISDRLVTIIYGRGGLYPNGELLCKGK